MIAITTLGLFGGLSLVGAIPVSAQTPTNANQGQSVSELQAMIEKITA